MKLITRQTRANEAARAWKEQYPYDTGYQKEIGEELETLGPTPDPDEVDKIIGNPSWTSLHSCDECKTEEVPVVQLGGEPDNLSNTAYICECCLRKALQLFQGFQP